MVKCSVCGFDNKPDAKFCMNCGSPIDHQKVSNAMDDVSEEKTVLLDPAAMQARVAEEIKKDKPAGAPPSTPAQPMMAAPPPMQAAPPPPPMQPMGGAPPPPKPMQAMAPPPMAPPPMGAPMGAPPPPQMMGGQPGMGMQPPMGGGQKTNVLAIVSVSLGGVSVIGICCAILGWLLGPAAIITGVLAKKQIAQTGEGGEKLALVGIILGALGLVLGVVSAVFGILMNLGQMGSN